MPDTPATAVISGAGQNIGRAIAVALARDGFDIVVNGRANRDACEAVAKDVGAVGRKALVVMADVGDSAAVSALKAQVEAYMPPVAVVVNNAAIRPQKPFLEMSDEDWHRVMNTDLTSAFYLCRAFCGAMVERGWGRVVNLTGMNAIHGYAGRAPVSAAKHGLWGLTKALAKEFGPSGVTVNAISPGPIDTEHADTSMTHHIKSQLDRIPVGRLGQPEDIAALTAFLCSDGGGFINGQMIASNGGTQT
ncbi:SDR family NAD(P)-dependent oxidoreductase [Thalassobaculum sp.]|uniref:SDR family NAD(P)-dependent oxidoreductase n=1 Tax=Thalassobaculum sp. TaxID=2022740 RepID=UPI003B5A717B